MPPRSKEAEPFLKQYGIVEAKYAALIERSNDWEKSPKEAIDMDWWRANLSELVSACGDFSSAVYSVIHSDDDRRRLGDVIHDVQKMQGAVSTYDDCVFGWEFDADYKRIALFEGDAGSGKSHLLGAALVDAIKVGSPAILIVGSHLNSHCLKSALIGPNSVI